MIRTENKLIKAIIIEYFKIEKELMMHIRNYKNEVFDMSNCHCGVIADEMYKLHYGKHVNVYVKIYYPKWRWSSALGYFSEYKRLWYKPWKLVKNTKKIIYLNGYKLDRDVPSLVGTLAHELTHVADSYSDYFFGHGNNRPEGKENTAPYWIGREAKKLCYSRLQEMLNRS